MLVEWRPTSGYTPSTRRVVVVDVVYCAVEHLCIVVKMLLKFELECIWTDAKCLTIIMLY